MLSRGFRRLGNWQSLAEFATKEADAVAFRSARALALDVTNVTSAPAANTKIDWAKYQSEVRHQELVKLIKEYHDQQVSQLDNLLKEDHMAEAKKAHLASADPLYNDMLTTANNAVEQSEAIVANGAKALYMSANNPSVSEVSTSEWIDSDQYWAAFVEKHQYYHNHLDSTTEDPESKEYAAKLKTELMKNLRLMDDIHPRKGMLYQKPSYEYYNFYKAVLVEHMTYYLVKTGGDARTFPELPHHSWMNAVYDSKFKMLNVLQRRRRIAQEESLARELDCEFMPHDLVHGEAYYTKLIAGQNTLIENTVARLMGSYSFLSDAVPVQTSGALISVKNSGSSGKWYSLGDDVNAVFFKPAASDTSSCDPSAAWASYSDHLALSGQKLHPVLNVAGEIFTNLLSERKQTLGGSWFNLPNESSADAFLRRVKKDDPCYEVYESYVSELKSKWESAKEIGADEVEKKIGGIEEQYYKDLATYEAGALYSPDSNPDTKAAVDKLSKAADGGELASMLESGGLIAIGEGGASLNADQVKALL